MNWIMIYLFLLSQARNQEVFSSMFLDKRGAVQSNPMSAEIISREPTHGIGSIPPNNTLPLQKLAHLRNLSNESPSSSCLKQGMKHEKQICNLGEREPGRSSRGLKRRFEGWVSGDSKSSKLTRLILISFYLNMHPFQFPPFQFPPYCSYAPPSTYLPEIPTPTPYYYYSHHNIRVPQESQSINPESIPPICEPVLKDEHGSKRSARNFSKSAKKITCPSKRRKKDLEFKQREQMANRNLCSNTLKIYLKHLRDHRSETYFSVLKTIKLHKLPITHKDFIHWLDLSLPADSAYVSLAALHKLIGNCLVRPPKEEACARVMRIVLRRFFLYQVYPVSLMSLRTSRKMRNLQVQKGRQILKQIAS